LQVGESKRRRLTLRGRLTLGALAVGLAAPALWLVPGPSPEPEISIPARLPEPLHTPPPEAFLDPPITEARWQTDEAAVREIPEPPGPFSVPGPLRVEYTFSPELMQEVFGLLSRRRVALGHVVVMQPDSGRVLAYASTDPQKFPPQRVYPAASLVKIVATAAAMDHAPDALAESCLYSGDPYRLKRRHLEMRRGREVSLRRALALSYNQCFARLTVHHLGSEVLLSNFDRFGLLESPAPAHAAGAALDPGDDRLALGRLGSGLDGLRITPLHGVRLAATLANGRLVTPHWVERVEDGSGRVLELAHQPDRTVLQPDTAAQLREMLTDTTRRGTASRAFRTRRGRPLLQNLAVAGKTGSLSGEDPDGRYEWFIGVAPAEKPSIAVAVLVVQGELYWATASQLAAEVLKVIFCPRGVCTETAVERFSPVERTAGGRKARAGLEPHAG
jgi:peptidoglycan glycosyltransferase